MHILYASDENYVRHAAASIASLMDHNPGAGHTVHCLSMGIGEDSLAQLESMCRLSGWKFSVHELGDIRRWFDFPVNTRGFAPSALARLFVARVLPETVEMRLDPRTKLLILAVTSVSVFMNKSIAVECVLAGIPLVLLSVSGNLKRMLKYAALFLALLLIQLFIVPRLPVTFGGIVYMFAVYIRKLLPCFMLGSLLIATTSVSKFLAAITKLRLSKGLTIALAITLRYFPTMREECASIRDAMALRGISASAAGLISHPIQTMEYVYVPLLVSASRISDEITQAAITRGIEHTGERSCIEKIAFSFADLLVVIAYAALVAGMIYAGMKGVF